MSRIAGVLRRTFGIVREHVGTDTSGNKYYTIPEQKTWTGGRERRRGCRYWYLVALVSLMLIGSVHLHKAVHYHAGRLLRARRMVEPANPTEYEYAEGNIPMEWDAWIRGRRKEPPSAKELLKNETYRENIKLKAREVEEKDLTLQAQEYEEGLVATSAKTVAKGHASITSFGKQEVSEDPTSTANAFQPGSWMPKK
ncbi:NADH dehydrogenase [ubiquinone] 1 alpha subcomplex assembly factor 2 isoform X2 [Cyclopterus lumpus]|uniref:NADH dehydrogenase [ubiquinone] 1 alpha subcomplex assembly factor 2 isoform X2 n=1 Tax=Cyclopterus lumpus TaxID=8103 RepID=UPI00148609C3|nr:NADH dehydrogenase [ubiquinone] 1 alpha subcomplex assembly factor 2 isoform X2 [Cyclopterus lumpus]